MVAIQFFYIDNLHSKVNVLCENKNFDDTTRKEGEGKKKNEIALVLMKKTENQSFFLWHEVKTTVWGKNT